MTENGNREIKVSIKTFNNLTTQELYEILKARAAVFVVEQNCPYQDLDDIDFISTHIFFWQDQTVLAYSRVFKDKESDMWHIGRVLTTQRNKNYGVEMMKEAIKTAEELGARCIEIEAQYYAIGFYEKFGFQISSEEFLLDGILHKRMMLQL